MTGERDPRRRAEETMARIGAGELKATREQVERLQSLLDGREAHVYADAERKRGMIGLLYERHIYLSKMWLLDKLGTTNKWNYPLLTRVRQILHEESSRDGRRLSAR